MFVSIILHVVPAAFNIVVLGIAALSLAQPRRYHVHNLGWLAIAWVLLLTYYGVRYPSHDFSFSILFSLAWLFLSGLLIGSAVLANCAATAIWRRMRGDAGRNEGAAGPDPILAALRPLQYLCWGIVSALLAYLALRGLMARAAHPILCYAVVLGFMSLLWIMPRVLAIMPEHWPPRPTFPTERAFLEGFRWSMLTVVLFGAGMAVQVARAADSIAGTEPYCIQVADNRSTYRSAETLADLSALTMKGGSRRHALLVVGEEPERRVYNWSYWQLAFEELPASRQRRSFRPVLVCRQQADFAMRLPTLFASPTGVTPVEFAGQHFHIPDRYQPIVSGAGWPGFYIAATAPGFEAHDEWLDVDRHWYYRAVFVSLRPPTTIEDWADINEGDQLVSEEEVAGLTRQTIIRVESGSRRTQYVSRDLDGTFTTLIACWATTLSNQRSCSHRFQRNGIQYNLRQSADDLENWGEIQDRLIALIDSFSPPDGADGPMK